MKFPFLSGCNILLPFSVSAQIWKVIKEQKSLFLKTREGCKYVASRQNEICLESTMSGLFLGNIVFLLFPCGYFTFIFKITFSTNCLFFQQKLPSFKAPSVAWSLMTVNQVFPLCWTSQAQITSCPAPAKERKRF